MSLGWFYNKLFSRHHTHILFHNRSKIYPNKVGDCEVPALCESKALYSETETEWVSENEWRGKTLPLERLLRHKRVGLYATLRDASHLIVICAFSLWRWGALRFPPCLKITPHWGFAESGLSFGITVRSVRVLLTETLGSSLFTQIVRLQSMFEEYVWVSACLGSSFLRPLLDEIGTILYHDDQVG